MGTLSLPSPYKNVWHVCLGKEGGGRRDVKFIVVEGRQTILKKER